MTAQVNHSHQAHTHDHPNAGRAPGTAAHKLGNTRYTCPMHSEIVRDAPGSCPKCGMTLTPILDATRRAAEYPWPMPPEILRSHPGSYTQCGMAHSSVFVVTNALHLKRVKL